MLSVPLPWTVSRRHILVYCSVTRVVSSPLPIPKGGPTPGRPDSLIILRAVKLIILSPGTEGLTRGAAAHDTGAPITIPVGPATLGRIINVTGDPIDERGPVKATKFAPIHAEPPQFVDQSTEAEILVTGIKVVDLLAPYARGGKIGLFGGAGVGKTVFIQELIVSTFCVENCSWPPY